MSNVPAWLTYASSTVSLVALGVSSLTYRRGAPRIKVKGTMRSDWPLNTTDSELHIEFFNRGLAAAQIVDISLVFFVFGRTLTLAPIPLDNKDMYSGPELPTKLEGKHHTELVYDLHSAIQRKYGTDFRLGFLNALRAYKISIKSILKSIYTYDYMFPRLVIMARLGDGKIAQRSLRKQSLNIILIYLSGKKQDELHKLYDSDNTDT